MGPGLARFFSAKGRLTLHPFFWGGITLVIAQFLTFFVASQEKVFLREHQIVLPEVSLEMPLIYFFVAVALMGLILFLVPVSSLKVIFRVLFAILFGWGTFIALSFSSPLIVTSSLALAASLIWFFKSKIWLHNLLLMVTLSSVGVVFGVLLTPWIAIFLMLALSIYDVVAVRLGYMMWMVKRLSASEVLPAFIFPKTTAGWGLNIRGINLEGEKADRDFSLLGGGDIGLPLILLVSVFFAHGFTGYLVVAGFSMLGLAGAYGVQKWWLKGRPTPALPPIFVFSTIGFLIVNFTQL
jgi:presenilin-like A22 family membrane protease